MTRSLSIVLFCVALIFALCTEVAFSHVIGVDFGSEYVKVAAPHGDQAIDIVLNELSQRKTENFIAFRNAERSFGAAAKSLAARFPLKTVSAVNQLIGMEKGSARVREFEELLYEYTVAFSNRDGIRIPVDDALGPFDVEELYAMFLQYSSKIAARDGVVDPRGVVVTIPFHTTVSERKAIKDATDLSGLDLLGYIHSTTAAAYYYGMRRRGFGNETVSVVIFDVGTTHTEVGLYTFSPPAPGAPFAQRLGTLSTNKVIEDRTLGGRAFDICIAQTIEKEAVAKLGVKPVLGGRQTAQLKSQFSLIRAANKVRETLSANSQTPYTVEGIAPDRDFHSVYSRDTFEADCSALFDRVTQLAADILAEAKSQNIAIKSFELMGGVARTPKIIADLSRVLGREPDRTLNMDEAASIGAAYFAVYLSPYYRTKAFKLDERVPSSILFTVHPAAVSKKSPATRVLLNHDSLIADEISLTLNRTKDFAIHLSEEGEEAKGPFGIVEVAHVQETLKKLSFFKPEIAHPNNSHTLRIQFRVNDTGLIHVVSAEAHVRYAAQVPHVVKVNVTNEAGEVEQKDETVDTIVMRTRSAPLEATFVWKRPRDWTAKEHAKAVKTLHDIEAHEQAKHERSTAKNDLESFLFWAKHEGFLEDSEAVAKAGSENTKRCEDVIRETEDWVEYGDGSHDTCSTKQYEEKLAALKQVLLDAVRTVESDSDNSAEVNDDL